jgi:hypothetical protein
LVKALGVAPTLLNEIELTVKFQQEDDLKSMCTAGFFKDGINMGKVRLIE